MSKIVFSSPISNNSENTSSDGVMNVIINVAVIFLVTYGVFRLAQELSPKIVKEDTE